MSTYWYFECLDHTPALQSVDEFTQHTDDGAYRAGVELAQQRPVDADGYSAGTGHFEGNARSFLVQHPTCSLGLVNEYGERRPLPGAESPRIADMAPGTTFTAAAMRGEERWTRQADGVTDVYGNVWAIRELDPSTIRDVTLPAVTT